MESYDELMDGIAQSGVTKCLIHRPKEKERALSAPLDATVLSHENVQFLAT